MPDVVFEIGARVHHERYGYGDVLDVRNQGAEITVVFDHDKNSERKILAAMGVLRLVPLGEEPEGPRLVEPDPPAVPVPVAAPPVKPPLTPVPRGPDPVFKRGDEVGLVSHPTDAPVGLVSVVRPRGGYRVDLYSGGIMSFEARELRLTKAAPEPSTVPTPVPVPAPVSTEPDALYVKMEEEIAKRGPGAIASVTTAAGLCEGALRYWRRQKRIPEGTTRLAVAAWIGTPSETAKRVCTFAPDTRVWNPGYGLGTVIKWYNSRRIRVVFDEYPDDELRILIADLWAADDPVKPPRDATRPAFVRSRAQVPVEQPKEEPMHPVHPAPAPDKAPPTPVVPPNSGVDYNAVLADLIARRDQLDRAIAAVQALVRP